MTVAEMRQRKQEKGYTYAQIAERSGVPVGTVQKIFTGETKSPRYDTLQALERIFTGIERGGVVHEACAYEVKSAHMQGSYTVDDYRALPEEQRVELIDGYFYDMAAPTYLHQMIAGEVYRQIANFIYDNHGDCQPLIAPVDIQLDCDEKTMVQPDVGILCRHDKIHGWGVYGAPDFILEVISPSTKRKDYTKKLMKYMNAGVREYWILDPYQEKLLVYFFESEVCPVIYGTHGSVPVSIYDGRLEIDLTRISEWIKSSKEADKSNEK